MCKQNRSASAFTKLNLSTTGKPSPFVCFSWICSPGVRFKQPTKCPSCHHSTTVKTAPVFIRDIGEECESNPNTEDLWRDTEMFNHVLHTLSSPLRLDVFFWSLTTQTAKRSSSHIWIQLSQVHHTLVLLVMLKARFSVDSADFLRS